MKGFCEYLYDELIKYGRPIMQEGRPSYWNEVDSGEEEDDILGDMEKEDKAHEDYQRQLEDVE